MGFGVGEVRKGKEMMQSDVSAYEMKSKRNTATIVCSVIYLCTKFGITDIKPIYSFSFPGVSKVVFCYT